MNPLDPSIWLLKADRDYGLASYAREFAMEFPDLICYHCQQAAEKYLKALLIGFSLPVKRTHDLEALLDQLIDVMGHLISSEHYTKARLINGYGVEVRYLGLSQDPSLNDVDEALDCASFFKDFAYSALTFD